MKPGMKTALRTAAWSTSGLLMLGAVAGTATAATHHKNSTTGADPADAGPRAVPPKVVHDLATVETSDGTFEEYASQFGEVAAISATSIKVVSDDDYSATYAIDGDTVVMKKAKKADTDDVAVGDKVFVRAQKSGDTFTADVIGDGKPPAGRGGPGHRPGGPGGPGGLGGPGGPGGPPPVGPGDDSSDS